MSARVRLEAAPDRFDERVLADKPARVVRQPGERRGRLGLLERLPGGLERADSAAVAIMPRQAIRSARRASGPWPGMITVSESVIAISWSSETIKCWTLPPELRSMNGKPAPFIIMSPVCSTLALRQ